MKAGDALRGVSSLFLDSTPIIYYVERHSTYFGRVSAIFNAISSGSVFAVTSPVTLAECLVLPLRQNNVSLQQDFSDLIRAGRNTHFVEIDGVHGLRASRLRAQYNVALLDGFQLAVAITAGCDLFVTNDARLRRINEVRVLLLDELED